MMMIIEIITINLIMPRGFEVVAKHIITDNFSFKLKSISINSDE